MSLLAVWAALFSLYPARTAALAPFMSTSHSRTKRFCFSVICFPSCTAAASLRR